MMTHVTLDNLLMTVAKYFEDCRFDDRVHLGLGDIRLTIGMQEEILRMIAEATGKGFDNISSVSTEMKEKEKRIEYYFSNTTDDLLAAAVEKAGYSFYKNVNPENDGLRPVLGQESPTNKNQGGKAMDSLVLVLNGKRNTEMVEKKDENGILGYVYVEKSYYGKIVVETEGGEGSYYTEDGTSSWTIPSELVQKIIEREKRLSELEFELNKLLEGRDAEIEDYRQRVQELASKLREKQDVEEIEVFQCKRHNRILSTLELRDLRAGGFEVEDIIKLREAQLI